MKKRTTFFALIAFIFSACLTPWKGDEGTITINFGGGDGRSVLADYFPPDNPEILKRLEYKITFSGNNESLLITAKDGDAISVTVALGRWDVQVDAYIIKTSEEDQSIPGYNVGDSVPFATGTNFVDVKAGRNPVSIQMAQFTFTVTFDTNEGTPLDPIHALPGDYLEELEHYAEPVKTDYLFDGWCIDRNLEESYDREPITKDITLYAKWRLLQAQMPVITSQPANAAIIRDASHSLSVTASVSDGGTLSYQWYSNTSKSNEGGTAVTGVTSDTTYNPPTNTAGTFYYFVEITNTLTDNGDGGTKTATVRSDAITLTIVPTGSVKLEYYWLDEHDVLVTSSEGTLTVAAGKTLIITPPPGTDLTNYTDIQWYVDGVITSTTGDTYTFPTMAPGKHIVNLLVVYNSKLYSATITITFQ